MSDQGGGYEAGWYPNPDGGPGLRWYDGTRWTDDYHYDQPPPPSGQPFAPQPYPTAPGAYQGYGYQGYDPYPAAAYEPPVERSPWGYFTHVLTENYANFEGRARRSEYWWFALIGFGAIVVMFFLVAVLTAANEAVAALFVIPVLSWIALIIPALAAAVRRLHDSNKSGWWLLIQLVPFGGIVLLVFLLIEGDRGPNQYGWPPK